MGDKAGRGEVKRAFSIFLGFVLVYTAVGIPAYIFYQRHRAEVSAAELERDAEKERAKAPPENQEAAGEAQRRAAAAPGGIHGPNAGKSPLVPHGAQAQPASVYDYLPAEQRRMLQPGRTR